MTGSLRIELTGPFAVEPALAALAAHATPGVERVDRGGRSTTRVLALPSGPVEVTTVLAADHLLLVGAFRSAEDRGAAAELVRRWLDLDADPVRIEAVLRADPLLEPLVDARPGLRVVGRPDGFEAAVSTVLGQQVSLAAGRTLTGRLVAARGEPGPGGLRRFPAPEVLAGLPVEELRAAIGSTVSRARTVRALASAVADGLSLLPGGDAERRRRELLALPGIGPWTVEHLEMRAFGDRDACPAGDLVLRRALGMAEAEVREHARGWRPHRAHAVAHLWAEAAYLQP
ncbi:DNA-3-methyladenine glycosylase family protein [Saccharopolyspora sp. MS10]|uniref:DNA-3-methyladenine glycosylase family protein n=1 Tax=Saccharopolyspora sp. MS10 TaxID=3385973 RepID=UPI0039A0ACCC